MSKPNPTLKTNILAEALLEIRFKPSKDLSLLVGAMNEKLSEHYPNFENMNIPDFPISTPEFDNMVRYRFYSKDRKKLYSLGKGMLAINTLNYSGFSSFREDMNKLLKIYSDVADIKSITRIGLRYINKIRVEKPLDELFEITLDLPKMLDDNQTGFSVSTVSKIKENTFVTKLLTNPFAKAEATLDLDCYKEEETKFELQELLSWIDDAHDVVYEIFKASLTANYFKELS